jgi:benzoyl-CoA reductase/2-hydroxyglutaryl-CoA dehydratase subunit BcrC/BadD/HgdB
MGEINIFMNVRKFFAKVSFCTSDRLFKRLFAVEVRGSVVEKYCNTYVNLLSKKNGHCEIEILNTVTLN